MPWIWTEEEQPYCLFCGTNEDNKILQKGNYTTGFKYQFQFRNFTTEELEFNFKIQ